MLVCPLFDAGGRLWFFFLVLLLSSFSSSLLSFISILQLFRGHQTLFALSFAFGWIQFIIARWRSTVWQYVRLSSIYTFNDVTDIIDSQIDVKYVPCFVPLDGFFTRSMILPDSSIQSYYSFHFFFCRRNWIGALITMLNHWPMTFGHLPSENNWAKVLFC